MTDVQPKETVTAVTITVDGQEVACRPGELVIAAAEREGTYIPRFCYHPRMRPVGMCRMCLVEIDTGRGPTLQPACMIPVAEGMKVDTQSPVTKKAQDGVLEFLLINHPLDCPVCDKGGECPLQDQTLSFGPGESRFVEEKRHFEKPIAISPLVHLDRERCILCDRCTRFSKEVAGDPLISFIDRGNGTQVNTFPDHPFASYFSGNTVQICPVGALTADPYRFKARPWDLEQVESTCTSCAVGCRVALQSSTDRLVRKLGVDVEPVNHGWLCDRGRFDFEAVNSDARVSAPMVRVGEALAEASWSDAFGRVAEALAGVRERHGAGSVAVLGGARLTNEGAYAWSKLARVALGTDNVDCQMGDGLPAEVVLGLPRVTIDDACAADVVVLLTGDLKEELPVLFLRLREAAVDHGVKLVEVGPVDSGLTRYAHRSVRHRPGEAQAAITALLDDELLRTARSVVCVLGRPSLAESADDVVAAADALLDAVPGTTFLSGLRRGNVHGALDMGLAPGLLPGRVSLAEGREWIAASWGEVPAEPGLDAAGILAAAADGRLQGLVLLGADPLSDFPDRDLARRALAGAGFVVAVDAFLTASSRRADVVLPAAMFGEQSGTTTNLEGRVSRLHQKVTAPGTARPDWMLAAELAARLGIDLGLASVEEVTDEIAAVAPAYAGLTASRMASAAGFDGFLAGDVVDSGHDAPPAMAQTEAPEIHAAVAQGDTVTGSAPEVTAPDPSLGDRPTGGSAAQADAFGASQTAAADPEAVAHSVAAAEGEGIVGDPSGGSSVSRPVLLSHRPTVTGRSVPPVDSYSLRLVAARKLYDGAVSVQHSPSLAGLAPGTTVRVHPTDLEGLGVASGGQVRVTSSRTSLTLTATADAAVPKGVVAIPFNQPGPSAADLIDAAAAVTDVRLERP